MKVYLHYSDSGFSTNPNSSGSTIRFSYICRSTVNLNNCLVIGPNLKLLLLFVFHRPALDGNLSVSIRPKLGILSNCFAIELKTSSMEQYLSCISSSWARYVWIWDATTPSIMVSSYAAFWMLNALSRLSLHALWCRITLSLLIFFWQNWHSSNNRVLQ